MKRVYVIDEGKTTKNMLIVVFVTALFGATHALNTDTPDNIQQPEAVMIEEPKFIADGYKEGHVTAPDITEDQARNYAHDVYGDYLWHYRNLDEKYREVATFEAYLEHTTFL